jgi:CRP/FNR family transcriptional regulator
MTNLLDKFLDRPEWQALTVAEREALNKVCRPRNYLSGEAIFHQNDECRGIYLIREGLVSVHKNGLDGNVVTLHLAREGDVLGYRPFLAGQDHLASAEVIRDCKTLFIPSQHVRRILLQNLDFGMALLRREAQELGEAEARFQEAVTQHLRYRLLHLLLSLNIHYGSGLPNGEVLLDLPISRQEMASMIGVRVETLSREIRHLTDDGLVKFSGHRAWLKDLPAIEDEIGVSGAAL